METGPAGAVLAAGFIEVRLCGPKLWVYFTKCHLGTETRRLTEMIR